ncbi:MAG TPA: hypothetical protein VHO69_09330, partial [Phototrophicaceae bacterium]|nr:hypothetical protein [Phototrophicaceae bacterium]
MSLIYVERPSDSPYIETITTGQMVGNGSTIRPAEVHWHLVIVNYRGHTQPIITGPLTTSGVVTFTAGAEILWIKFKLGTFMPHLPMRKTLDAETHLPTATNQSFWLQGSAWQFPDYDNVETFIARLVRDEVLVCDPVVTAALNDQPPAIPARTR